MAGQAVQRWIMQDTYELRKELKQRNIKVVADEQEEFLVYYKTPGAIRTKPRCNAY